MIETQHPSPEEIAAYVDRAVTSDERARLEAHLSGCAICCDEIVAISRLRQKPARARRAWWIGGSAAAAAVLTMILVNPPWNGTQGPEISPPVERSPDATPAIRAISPADGAIVSMTQVSFSWSAADDASLYHFVLTTEGADSVWAETTPDTTVALPSSTHLRGGTYLWYVDALMADGRSSTTGLQSFRIRE